MRRSSLITIILLVLIIIGLSVALVITNLPKTEISRTDDVVENVKDTSKEKVEKVSELSLTDEKVTEMQARIDNQRYTDYYFLTSRGEKDANELSDSDKIGMAYRYYMNVENNYGGQVVEKSKIDQYMKLLFGDTDYIPCDARNHWSGLRYNSDNNNFEAIGGGGGPTRFAIYGIFKVDEYSDRYEAYVKYLVVNPYELYDHSGFMFDIYPNSSRFTGSIGQYSSSGDGITPMNGREDTLSKLVEGVEAKNFAENLKNEYKLVLSKFYDEASEYKVTFMKNDDGSFYWLKTEVIK